MSSGGGEPPRRVFDAGLQPERTALAWQRTILAIVVAAIAGARVLVPLLGGWAVVAAFAGVLAGAWMWAAARRRVRAVRDLLLRTDDLGGGPGALPLLLAAAVCAAGAVVALLAVLLGRTG